MKCETVHFKSVYSLINFELSTKFLQMRKWALAFVKSQQRKTVEQFREHYKVIIQYTNNKQVKNANEIVANADFMRFDFW